MKNILFVVTSIHHIAEIDRNTGLERCKNMKHLHLTRYV